MTVVSYLIKKHKVMDAVFEELNKYYGQPNWLKKPRDGQDPLIIVDQWITKLGDFEEDVLRMACQNLYEKKKLSRFPTLAHVLEEAKVLKMARQREVRVSETPKYLTYEDYFRQRDLKLGKPFYLPTDYRRAVDYVLNTLLRDRIGDQQYRLLERTYDYNRIRGEKFKLANEMGLFECLDEVLKEIKASRGFV